jgi:hypothetical protein
MTYLISYTTEKPELEQALFKNAQTIEEACYLFKLAKPKCKILNIQIYHDKERVN